MQSAFRNSSIDIRSFDEKKLEQPAASSELELQMPSWAGQSSSRTRRPRAPTITTDLGYVHIDDVLSSQSGDSIDSGPTSPHNVSSSLVYPGRNFLAVPTTLRSRQNSLDSEDCAAGSFGSTQRESVIGRTSFEKVEALDVEPVLEQKKIRWTVARKALTFLRRRWRPRVHNARRTLDVPKNTSEVIGSPGSKQISNYQDHRHGRNAISTTSFDSALGAATVMAGIIAGSITGAWSPVDRSNTPQSEQIIEHGGCLDPSSTTPVVKKHESGDDACTPKIEPLAQGNVDQSTTSPSADKAESISSKLVSNSYAIDPQDSAADFSPPYVDEDYPNPSIFPAGEGVYFSTTHYEATDQILFKNARNTLERLQPDLEPIFIKLKRKVREENPGNSIGLATLDLRMAGRLLKGDKIVRLSPSVWISCCDRSACLIVQRRLDELSWLNLASSATVYVRQGLQLAVADSSCLANTEHLDLTHGITFWSKVGSSRIERQIHIHVESSEDMFACGSRCCITTTEGRNDEIINQQLCRIGGYLSFDTPSGSKLVGVTTGHGLIQPWIDHFLQEPSNGLRISEETLSSDKETTNTDSHRRPELDSPHTNNVQWRSLPLYMDNINFVFQAIPDGYRSFSIKPNDVSADFLLLSADALSSLNPSADTSRDTGANRVTHHLSDVMLSSECTPATIAGLEHGMMHIKILPDVVPLLIHGTILPTRKVHLTQPLAQGSSGLWIVQGDALCGMIIAVMQAEPFALMLTAEKLLTDVETLSTGMSNLKIATESDLLWNDNLSTGSDLTATEGRGPAIRYTPVNGTQRAPIRSAYLSVERNSIRDSLSQADSRLKPSAFGPTNEFLTTTNMLDDSPFIARRKTVFRGRRIYKLTKNSASWIRKKIRKLTNGSASQTSFRTQSPIAKHPANIGAGTDLDQHSVLSSDASDVSRLDEGPIMFTIPLRPSSEHSDVT